MMRKLLLLVLAFFTSAVYAQNTPAKLVNPFVGTGGHGHTFPGATVPFGMVQLSPDTRIDGSWDGCGGYHYSDSLIYGFSHTHLSGTGCSDYGDILLMPMKSSPDLKQKNYPSSFIHKAEKAGAGWYEVILRDQQIKAELTTSTRVGFHRYTFPEKKGFVVLDLLHRDELLEGKVEQVDDHTIRGMRRSKAWAIDQVIYFEIAFSQKISGIKGSTNSTQGDLRSTIQFDTMSSNELEVKVGVSFSSMEGAHLNLKSEASNINFDLAKANAIKYWETELNRIQIKGGTLEQQKIFYTALYHTMIQPNTVSDVDGSYRGMDKKVHKAEGFTYYSVFSLWDTFRAAHPLYAILYPERTRDFIKTFLRMFQEGGRLPVWELASNETDCMIGYHNVSVMVDAYFKGIKGFDTKLALEAMQKSATWDHLGLPAYMDHGFLSVDDEHESVSKTLEYAYDDWCIARFAEALNQPTVYSEYAARSNNWRNLFNPESGFMQPKKNGSWLSPFDPREVNNHFTEANSWQYSFFVPHDIYGLAQAHGGQDALIKKLLGLFEADSKTTGRTQSDITGLIGQYAHGNEPSHHMAWMFSALGEPKHTQTYVRRIMSEMYHNAPDGLSGNEDCGQMSAWYVFAAMGFYPLCPGNPSYVVGAPLFDEIKITPVNGKLFSIKAPGASKNAYTTAVEGKPNFWFNHSSIVNGESIALTMSTKAPVKQAMQRAPFSYNWSAVKTPPGKGIHAAPTLLRAPMTFRDSFIVELTPESRLQVVRYTLDGRKPSLKDPIFPRSGLINSYATYAKNGLTDREGIVIRNSCTLSFAAFDGNSGDMVSPVSTAKFFKIPHNYTIQIQSKYNPQYTAGGDEGIIDGLFADENWRKGGWQGYQGQDFECVVDLKKVTEISTIGASFLQDSRSWILFPKEVRFEYSLDGIQFIPFATDSNFIDPKDTKVQLQKFEEKRAFVSNKQNEPMTTLQPTAMRFIRVKAKNFGVLPEWHQGAGGEAFIFIDEIWAR
jgi:predicted alpha-1,2-mannosidase